MITFRVTYRIAGTHTMTAIDEEHAVAQAHNFKRPNDTIVSMEVV